jgi:hypothetical protein
MFFNKVKNEKAKIDIHPRRYLLIKEKDKQNSIKKIVKCPHETRT